jgi:hypothetical protein
MLNSYGINSPQSTLNIAHLIRQHPLGNTGIDEISAHVFGDRDAVVTVPDKVGIPNFDQLYGWETDALVPGQGDVQPTVAVVQFERVEFQVEITATPFAALDLVDPDGVSSAVAAGTCLDPT